MIARIDMHITDPKEKLKASARSERDEKSKRVSSALYLEIGQNTSLEIFGIRPDDLLDLAAQLVVCAQDLNERIAKVSTIVALDAVIKTHP